MEARVDGKVALVTGATQGIGRAIAETLARAGAAGLLLTGRDEVRGNAVAKQLSDGGVATAFIAAELGDPATPPRLIAECLGTLRPHRRAGQRRRRHRPRLFPGRRSRRSGQNCSTSTRARRSSSCRVRSPRCASGARAAPSSTSCRSMRIAARPSSPSIRRPRAALAVLTRNAANAHRFDRIRVNGINVGWADTPAERIMQAETLGHGPGWLEAANASQPFGRLLAPQDVANLAVFLLSDAAGPMTGALIDQEQRVMGSVSPLPGPVETLGPSLLGRLPQAVQKPAYDRSALAAGMAHIGVGAFHRCHQAEYTDDLLGSPLRPLGRRRHQYSRSAAFPDARTAIRALYAPDPRRRSRRGADHRQHRLGGRQPGKPGSGAGSAGIAGDRCRHAHRDGKGLLPHTVQRRAGPRPPRHRSRPRRSRSAAQPARPHRAGAGASHDVARPSGHADELRQYSGQRRRACQCRERDRDQARTRPRGMDRRQRGLPVEHGGPHRSGDIAGRYRHGRAELRLPRPRGRRRRAVPPVGDRAEIRGPRAAMGSGRRQLRRRRDAVRAPQDAHPQRCAVVAVLSRRAGRARTYVRRHRRSACCRPSSAAC